MVTVQSCSLCQLKTHSTSIDSVDKIGSIPQTLISECVSVST